MNAPQYSEKVDAVIYDRKHGYSSEDFIELAAAAIDQSGIDLEEACELIEEHLAEWKRTPATA